MSDPRQDERGEPVVRPTLPEVAEALYRRLYAEWPGGLPWPRYIALHTDEYRAARWLLSGHRLEWIAARKLLRVRMTA